MENANMLENKFTEKQIDAMVRLLDDPSNIIYEDIHNKLFEVGEDALPRLAAAKGEDISLTHKERILQLANEIQYSILQRDIVDWAKKGGKDLLEAMLLISRFDNYNFDRQKVDEMIDSIEAEVAKRLEENPDEYPFKILNDVILVENKFKGNVDNYSSINNSFITKSIDSRMGNPIMLSILYIIVSQRLGLSIVGINSPRHFIIGYAGKDIDLDTATNQEILDNIDLFIDPFRNGVVYSAKDFLDFVTKIIGKENTSVLIASNIDIVRRVFNNLIYGYNEIGETEKAKNLLQIVASIA